jgi:phage terminase large subunit-like protein
MATKLPVDSPLDLLQLAADELERSIILPNILNYQPYGDQGPFHECDSFGRVLTAGNRAGKTDCMVVEFIWVASNTHPYRERPAKWGHGPVQLRIFAVDVTKGIEQIMLPKFKRWMTRDMMVDGSWDKSWDSKNLILTFSNGSTIDFLTYGMTLEKMGGVPRHMIGFDEEPPRDIFNESLMRLKDFDGIWIIAATPVNGIDWIYDLLVEPAQSGDLGPEVVQVFELDARLNPYLQGGNDEKFYIGMDKEERAIREEGKYVARGGLVFPRFKDDIEHYEIERPWRHEPCEIYTATDYGWNNPTAWLWIAVYNDGSAHVFSEHYADHMEIKDHARIVLERERQWGLHSDRIIRVGDPAMKQANGQTAMSYLQVYSHYGVDIGVEGITNDVTIGVERLQHFFHLRPNGKPLLTISPNCRNLLRELKKLRWATYESQKTQYQKNKQELIHKKDDHAFDALRYWSTMMPDPRPDSNLSKPRNERTALTLPYDELADRMRAAGEFEFVDDTTDTVLWDQPEQWEQEYETW